MELEPRYDHRVVEDRWYEIWEKEGLFRPEAIRTASKTKPYSIAIPPPNVTGQLHVGHALNHTIQDVLIRYHRKRGGKTLWLPGTDHAGIATQNRVEKNLREEGTSRLDLGREKFVEKIWEWKEHSGGQITRQMRKLGESVDWSRERFTMEEDLSAAVTKVFVELYDKGLIFRGERIINWCPSVSCTTALANDEVEHVEREGNLWYIKYPYTEGEGYVVVATTRPETMLGDTAVAVHPEDERFAQLHGRTVRLPLMDREIPVVLDDAVDREFGTGAVKITPAHDPNDFEMGRRHNLPSIRIMDDHAKINEKGGKFAGLDRFVARKKIVAELEELGLLEKIEEHRHAVGTCYRCNQVIEPIQSLQWFVNTRPLAEKAIAAVKKDQIRFYPKRWENLYFDWMNNIQDWCISRQLWWGHRIPVYYCDDCGEHFATEKKPKKCTHCNGTSLHQDPDVLDTWFSSALWPFSTLGWPKSTKDLETFYPTSVLVTSFDIIFFWVARMIMMGLFVMKKPPFRHVYIHGLMRDDKGRKISKSLGNNIDPLVIIAEYGADAYRFFMMATLSEGKDAVFSEKRIRGYQNFANKIWNSTRFLFMNLPDSFRVEEFPGKLKLEEEDWWILRRMDAARESMEKALGEYKFHLAADAIYTFVWNEYCDWYIELIKPRIFGKLSDESMQAARQTAFHVLRNMLDLLHPFMPFITEEIYEKTMFWHKTKVKAEKRLITSAWPQKQKFSAVAKKACIGLELIQEVIGAARTIRAEAGLLPDKKIRLIVRTYSKELIKVIASKSAAIERLATASSIETVAEHTPARFEAVESFSAGEIYLPLEGLLDFDKETIRLQGEMEKAMKQLEGIDKKLSNEKFIANAPEDVVAGEREKSKEIQERLKLIRATLKRYGSDSGN